MRYSIKDIVDICKGWQSTKFDGLIVIDGNRGLGKSTVAIKIANRLEGFSIKHHVIFSREDVIKAISTGQHKVYVADEMINAMHNRDFFSQDQKKLIKILNMYRDACNILICCIPNFSELDKQFKSLVKMRISVIRRGLAVVHMKKASLFSNDAWDTNTNLKMEYKMTKKSGKVKHHKFTTFCAYLDTGSALSSKQQEIYDKVKFEKRAKLYEGDEEINTIADNKSKQYDLLLQKIKEGGLTKLGLQTLCQVNGWKYNTILANLNNRLKDSGIHGGVVKILSTRRNDIKVHHNNIIRDNQPILPQIKPITTNRY